jgi:hypothetical protein
MHLSGPIQGIRDAVHRIPKPHISASRTSLDSEQHPKSEVSDSTTLKDHDTISVERSEKQHKSRMYPSYKCIRRGLVVRISAFHAGGPGSIPGVGMLFFFSFKLPVLSCSFLY